jgi:cell division septum initiation protein DivIVA
MTEVVYRLYETVDELTTVIENARSVPMSSSCMVPRDHLLDLLDDLRESLPEDVQAAGAIVEQRTEILQQAQAEAERLTGRTRGESEQLLGQARRTRDEILGTARRQRDDLLAQAQAEAEEVLLAAEEEAERLLAEGRRQRDALLEQARLEHEQLISETDVYRPMWRACGPRSTSTSTAGSPTSGRRSSACCGRWRRPGRPCVNPDWEP